MTAKTSRARYLKSTDDIPSGPNPAWQILGLPLPSKIKDLYNADSSDRSDRSDRRSSHSGYGDRSDRSGDSRNGRHTDSYSSPRYTYQSSRTLEISRPQEHMQIYYLCNSRRARSLTKYTMVEIEKCLRFDFTSNSFILLHKIMRRELKLSEKVNVSRICFNVTAYLAGDDREIPDRLRVIFDHEGISMRQIPDTFELYRCILILLAEVSANFSVDASNIEDSIDESGCISGIANYINTYGAYYVDFTNKTLISMLRLLITAAS